MRVMPGFFAARRVERMKISRAAVFVVLAVSLAGCASEAPPEVAEPAPIETPVVTPTPTSEPTKPALSDLVLTPDGLDYLVTGEPVPEVESDLAIVSLEPDYCAASSGAEGDFWVSTYPGGEESSFYITVDDGDLYRIFITSPEILTEEGIGIGSTEADVVAAYPTAKLVTRNPSVNMYVVKGDSGQLTIEVPVGDEFGADAKGTVTFMTSMTLMSDAWTVSNTGAGATCQA